MQLLDENKSLSLFKKILNLLGEYDDQYPATGVGGLFSNMVEQGMKVMPKDSRALEVLEFIMHNPQSGPAKVQELLNLRFSGLPTLMRPFFKNGRSKEVAFWERNGKVFDKVIDLLDASGEGSKGTWSTCKGEKVSLVDMTAPQGGE
jgi:hypothetical protein